MKEKGKNKKAGKSKKSKGKHNVAFKLNKKEKTALIGFVVLILIVVLLLSLSDNEESYPSTAYETVKDEPQFVKEGELFFLQKESGDTLKKIAIEIADSDQERAQGLMYRSSMADSLGMLFIFDQAEEQSFWMKNTIISLDILYADAEGEVLTMYKYTVPYSEAPIPSYEKAKYVVEVIGGFTDRYNIQQGDRISFIRTDDQ